MFVLKRNHFHAQLNTDYDHMLWNTGNLHHRWVNPEVESFNSLTHKLISWTKDEQTEWFTDSKTYLLNETEVNLRPDEKIHWFRYWPPEWQRSRFTDSKRWPTWMRAIETTLKLIQWLMREERDWSVEERLSATLRPLRDSLTQTWICWIKEKQIPVLNEGFADSKTEAQNSGGVFGWMRKQRMSFMTERFTESITDPLNETGRNQKPD